jgi:hypothetical protein
MALTSAQKVTVSEITREPLATVSTAADALTAEQQTVLIADTVTWNLIRDSHVKLKGGSDGLDFDNARKRAAIFYRVRDMLGFDFIPYDLDDTLYASSSEMIPHTTAW